MRDSREAYLEGRATLIRKDWTVVIMKGTYVRNIAFSGVLLGCVLGCGASPPPPAPTPSAVAVPDKLPDLDEPFGPLDEGRLKVSPPKGWHIASRSSNYVIRFQADMMLGYPTILVTAEDFTQTRNVDKDNVGQFAKQITAALEANPKVLKLVAPIEPIELGGRQYIAYHRRAKIKGKKHKILERWFFETVVAGRKYTVELQTLEGTVNRYRPHAMAVAGAIEFREAHAVEPVDSPIEPVATPEKADDPVDVLPEGDFEDEL